MAAKALVYVEKTKVAVQEVPKPQLRDGHVLVKVRAVGINPTDWKAVRRGSTVGARVGCDYAGVVDEVGNNLGRPFKKGDRIAGMIHGSHLVKHDYGAFGEYALAKADVALHIPDNITDEEAATLGVSITTVGQGLYKSLELPQPPEDLASIPEPGPDAETILIYGGSSATGIFGIQYARLSGLRVVTTASPRNHAYLRELGAAAVFDYRSPTCGADIRAWAAANSRGGSGRIWRAWDCISEGESPRICAAALAADGADPAPRYGSLLPVEPEALQAVNPHVRDLRHTLGYDIFGESYSFAQDGTERVGDPGQLVFGREFWGRARALLEKGLVKTVRPTVNRGGAGLEGVLVGLEELKQGNVSGGKLVYTL